MKRFIALFMAVMLFLQVMPVPKAAASEMTLEGLITQQYDSFVGRLTGGKAEEGADRLVNHSIKGGGTLNMGQNDVFTKSLLSTNLFRSSFIHAATVAIEHMQDADVSKVFMRGTSNWYDTKRTYYNKAYEDNENGDDKDDALVSPTLSATQNPYEGSFNDHDDAMILVVGYCQSRMTFRQVSATDDAVTYKASIKVFDTFDFSGADYSGSNSTLAKLLTWMGTLLSLGLLSTYKWNTTAEIELTVPNDCIHSSAEYRWEYDGNQDLVSIVSGGNVENKLTKRYGSVENGVFIKTSYITDHPIQLRHNMPWELEFKCEGGNLFALGPVSSIWKGDIYLRKYRKTLFFGEYVYLNETDEKPTQCHYGISFPKSSGVDLLEEHTYLLKNKVSADGSNMVYLYLDGVEIGPMNQYYHGNTSQEATSDWVNGKDITIKYLAGGSYPFDNISIDYIQVWENGREEGPLSYCTTKTVASTCTKAGYTQNTCTLCGAVFKTDNAPANGHSFGQWTVEKKATCSAEGAERRDCTACDHYETRDIAKTDHEWSTTVTVQPTCTENGAERKACKNCEAAETYEISARGHSWEDASVPMKRCTACSYVESSCRIVLPEELKNLKTVWVDGMAYPAENGVVTLGNTASCLTTYEPEMQVYELNWAGESYEAHHIPELDGLLEHAGTTLRTEGVPGIRIITAMDRDTREALTGDGLAGYTLTETGTVAAFAEDALVLGESTVQSNYAYKKGEADPVYKKTKDQVLYTNVLVGYSRSQYGLPLYIRPYCILEKDGKSIAVYGEVLTTTIGQMQQS